MAEPQPAVRQRKVNEPNQTKRNASSTRQARAKLEDEDDYSPYLDILRVLAFLALASCALSYLISNGDGFFWGMKQPRKYLQPKFWRDYLRGPLHLTPAELASFDGTDESKPIYIAINGSIYDVTPGARIYGPGGSYHWFAGVDASRSFVTGCFATDRTPDMRGVEEMFLPLDDPEADSHWSATELEAMKASELEEAKRRVHDALKHWVDFFAKNKKYHYVGEVVREPGWLETEPRRGLCERAALGRSKRSVPDKS